MTSDAVDRVAEWAQRVASLNTELQRRNPRRARGGRDAFAGFAFQIHAALLGFVQALAIDHHGGVPSFHYEQIADFVLTAEDVLYTHEVKLTLNRTTLYRALGVFYDVKTAAIETDPDTAEHLRFRLITRNLELHTVGEVIALWAQRHADRAIAQSVADAVDVVVGKQPRHELYALLAARFRVKKPAQLVDKWVRRIVDDALDQGDALADGLVDDVYDAADDDALPFTMLSAGDREPDFVERREGGFLVGEQPTLQHLRSGFFATDFKAEQVEEQFWLWYDGLVADPAVSLGGRVPVFWIEGPSGSGKSVLLLQLLARLNAKHHTTVAWLSGSTDQLSIAAKFARDLGDASTMIIGIDDPYPSNPQCDVDWNSAMSQLNVIRQTDEFTRIPIFVSCGPSDHLERFRDKQYHNTVIASYVNGAPTAAETSRLRDWYRSRTGETRNMPTAESKTLPAQLFFEWWKNEGIVAFALRFRDRVSGLGDSVRDLIDQVLALNRIYIGYPNELKLSLNPASLDALKVLERDLHFETRGTGRKEYWLSHPHLANILYNAWYPEMTAINVRTSHLSRTLTAALYLSDRGDAAAAILSAILAASSDGEPTNLRVRGAVLRGMVGTVGPLAAEHVKHCGFAFLAAWVRASTAAPKAMLWNPVKTAIRTLQVDSGEQAGRTELFTALVESGDPAGAIRVKEIAEVDPHSPGWDTVMRSLLACFPVSELSKAITNGARTYPQDRDRIAVLEQALAIRADNAHLNETSIELLALDDTAAMANVARQMATSPVAACRTSVVDWLSREPRRENGPSLISLLQQRKTPILVMLLAKTWLIQFPEASYADELFGLTIDWPRLQQADYTKALRLNLASIERTPNSPVVKRMRKLLLASPTHTSWSYLFGLYCIAEVDLGALRELGIWWLNNNVGAQPWSSVFLILTDTVAVADPHLAALGSAELDRVEEQGDPHQAWASLISSVLMVVDNESRGPVLERALAWMQAQPDQSHARFTFVLQQVLREGTPAMIERSLVPGLSWLRFHPSDRSWSYVWQVCVDAAHNELKLSLLDLAEQWLRANRPGWGQVFRRLWLEDSRHERCLPLASNWLERDQRSDQWPAVLALVIDHLPQAQVMDLCARWFSGATNQHGSVGFVWRLLIDDGRYPHATLYSPLRPALITWLSDNGRSRAWWHVWKWMMNEAPDSTKDLILAALHADLPLHRCFAVGKQLRKYSVQSPAGDAVWEALEESFDEQGPAWYPVWTMATPSSDRFWSLGFRLLDCALPSKFPYTWITMWDSRPARGAREALSQLGQTWCATTRDSKRWPEVWARLEKSQPVGTAPYIIEIAQSWLDDLVSRRFKERDAVMLRVQSHFNGVVTDQIQ